jgi:hypothetical protein
MLIDGFGQVFGLSKVSFDFDDPGGGVIFLFSYIWNNGHRKIGAAQAILVLGLLNSCGLWQFHSLIDHCRRIQGQGLGVPFGFLLWFLL